MENLFSKLHCSGSFQIEKAFLLRNETLEPSFWGRKQWLENQIIKDSGTFNSKSWQTQADRNFRGKIYEQFDDFMNSFEHNVSTSDNVKSVLVVHCLKNELVRKENN
jgi:hypothetical protein